jgi:hypothetical protein
MPRCSLRQDRRVLVPCFSSSHSPAPHRFNPVLSTSRCKGSAPLLVLDRRCGTSSVSARRLRVEWSGTARVTPSRPIMEPITPSVWRRARWNTVLSISAVRIAKGEYHACPPSGGPRCGLPGRDRLVGKPNRQALALAQAGVIRRPVSQPALLPWTMVATRSIGLERQGGIRIRTAVASYPKRTRTTNP